MAVPGCSTVERTGLYEMTIAKKREQVTWQGVVSTKRTEQEVMDVLMIRGTQVGQILSLRTRLFLPSFFPVAPRSSSKFSFMSLDILIFYTLSLGSALNVI